MKRFVQIDNGRVTGHVVDTAPPSPDHLPPGRSFVESATASHGDTYDAGTGEFTAAVQPVNTRLSHADVLALLQPTEWAEMNKFHPEAPGHSPSGVAYSDPQVFWAVSVFKAAYVDLGDARFGQIIQLLTAKGILTPARATELQQQMAAAAAAK
jgi:hypothetical protein